MTALACCATTQPDSTLASAESVDNNGDPPKAGKDSTRTAARLRTWTGKETITTDGSAAYAGAKGMRTTSTRKTQRHRVD